MYSQNSLKLSLEVPKDTVVVALALPFAGGRSLSRLDLLTCRPSRVYVIVLGNSASLEAAQKDEK